MLACYKSLKKFTRFVLSFVFGSIAFYNLELHFSRWFGKPKIISVTYHDTPDIDLANFCKQIDWFRSKFDDCSSQDLQFFLQHGVWLKSRPGIIITFDDGLASNYLNASRVLEDRGFTGWFMVPSGILDLADDGHFSFATSGLIDFNLLQGEKRLFMSKKELVNLNRRGHQIVCHSYSHMRLSNNLSDEQLRKEVVHAKSHLEYALGESVNAFAWVGGEEYAYSEKAMSAIKQAGFKLVFATNCAPILPRQNPLLLERYHVDVKYTLNEIRFAVSWIYTLMYRAKRLRVQNILNRG